MLSSHHSIECDSLQVMKPTACSLHVEELALLQESHRSCWPPCNVAGGVCRADSITPFPHSICPLGFFSVLLASENRAWGRSGRGDSGNDKSKGIPTPRVPGTERFTRDARDTVCHGVSHGWSALTRHGHRDKVPTGFCWHS